MEGETACKERPPGLAGTGIGAEYESYDWCEQNLRWWFAGGAQNYLKFILKLYTINCPFHTSSLTDESLSVHHHYFNIILQNQSIIMRAFLTANWNFSPGLILFLSSWCEEIDWEEWSQSIIVSATKLSNLSTSPDRIFIADWWKSFQFDHLSTIIHQKARVFGIKLNISGIQGWSIFIWTICLKDTWLSF